MNENKHAVTKKQWDFPFVEGEKGGFQAGIHQISLSFGRPVFFLKFLSPTDKTPFLFEVPFVVGRTGSDVSTFFFVWLIEVTGAH